MNLPKVSVIIPNYNYAKYLPKAIDSVAAQTYRNIEIIVVDDGSTDESINVVDSYGEKVKLIKQKNQGVSAARNTGVENSSGDYVAFLDADDIWLPEKLKRQMQKFTEDSDIGLVHCKMTYIDPNDKVCGEDQEGMEGFVAGEFLRFERAVVNGAGSTCIVPKRIFHEIHGFDIKQSTAADWDFSYRVAVKYKIGFVPESLVLYRVHGTNMHNNINAMEHDMLLGYEKAFAAGASADRGESYGNLHKTLAGSFFYSKQYSKFFRHSLLSVWNKPSNLGYFLQFPFRRMRKRSENG